MSHARIVLNLGDDQTISIGSDGIELCAVNAGSSVNISPTSMEMALEASDALLCFALRELLDYCIRLQAATLQLQQEATTNDLVGWNAMLEIAEKNVRIVKEKVASKMPPKDPKIVVGKQNGDSP